MVDASRTAHARTPLSALSAGTACVVTGLDPAVTRGLEDVGICVGSALVVEHRIPLGGPLVVRVGTARVALGRPVAKGVRVLVAGAGSGRPVATEVAAVTGATPATTAIATSPAGAAATATPVATTWAGATTPAAATTPAGATTPAAATTPAGAGE